MDSTENLHGLFGIPSEVKDEFMSYAERISFGKKEIVQQEGARDEYTWFVESGSVRGYVMREDKCVILFFGFEGDPASLRLGFSPSQTSGYSVETMEPSTMLRIPRQHMEKLFAHSAAMSNWGRRLAENMLHINEEYFADYSWREKGAQYLRLLHKYPELLQRVPLKDLASYLFVTPQTLSRIRAEIK